MTVWVFKGNESEGLSIDLVARQVAQGIPGSVIASSTSDFRGTDLVINLLYDQAQKILDLRRYVGKFQYMGLLAGSFIYSDAVFLMHIMHHYTGSPLVVHSPYSYAKVVAAAKEFLNPATQKRLLANVHLIPYGIEPGFHPTPASDEMATNWIVPFNRLAKVEKNLAKHVDLTAKITAVSNMRGRPITSTMYLVDRSTAKVSDIGAFGKIEIPKEYTWVPQPSTREEYKENARKHGAFICVSPSESFGLYYLELIASGCVGLFLDKPWVRTLLPNYPFVAKSDNELIELALDVHANWPEYRKLIETDWGPWVRLHYDLGTFQTNMAALVQRTLEGDTK